MFAARVGDLASAKLLVAAGANVDDADAWGVSATTLAAHSDFGDVVEFLLEKGANPNAAASGFTALHEAIMHRNEKVVRALLEHGANANAPLLTWTPDRRSAKDLNLRRTWWEPLLSGWLRASPNRVSCACFSNMAPIRCLCSMANTSWKAEAPDLRNAPM